MVKLNYFKLRLANLTLDMGKNVIVEAERDAVILKGETTSIILSRNSKGYPIALFPNENGLPDRIDVVDLPAFLARLLGCGAWWEKFIKPKL